MGLFKKTPIYKEYGVIPITELWGFKPVNEIVKYDSWSGCLMYNYETFQSFVAREYGQDALILLPKFLILKYENYIGDDNLGTETFTGLKIGRGNKADLYLSHYITQDPEENFEIMKYKDPQIIDNFNEQFYIYYGKMQEKDILTFKSYLLKFHFQNKESEKIIRTHFLKLYEEKMYNEEKGKELIKKYTSK